MIVSSIGVIMGAIFLSLALNAPIEARTTFFIFMAIAALFMPFSSPNVVSTVYDVTMPEVRSTAQSVEYFIENAGAATAPLLAGIIADASSMHNAILSISLIAWGLSLLFYFGTMFFIDADITSLRAQMSKRAEDEKARQAA